MLRSGLLPRLLISVRLTTFSIFFCLDCEMEKGEKSEEATPVYVVIGATQTYMGKGISFFFNLYCIALGMLQKGILMKKWE